jgi:hypothetical protein
MFPGRENASQTLFEWEDKPIDCGPSSLSALIASFALETIPFFSASNSSMPVPSYGIQAISSVSFI